jgi:hypothetical protein
MTYSYTSCGFTCREPAAPVDAAGWSTALHRQGLAELWKTRPDVRKPARKFKHG